MCRLINAPQIIRPLIFAQRVILNVSRQKICMMEMMIREHGKIG